jgi:hypothetical protein
LKLESVREDGHPGRQYAVAFDGQRFLVNILAEEGAYNQIGVVLNWTAALKK